MTASEDLAGAWAHLARDFQGCHATNPRDRAFGLLGLTQNEVAPKIIPDYDAGVAQVYTPPFRPCWMILNVTFSP